MSASLMANIWTQKVNAMVPFAKWVYSEGPLTKAFSVTVKNGEEKQTQWLQNS